MSTQIQPRLRGPLAPVLTPFRHDLEIDAGRFLGHCRWLIGTGAGLAIFGTNSEASSLSASERHKILDLVVEAGIDPARLMPGTGACALPEAVDLTRAAVNAGVAGVLVLPPFFFSNPGEDGVFAYYAELIERVADDRLAIYLYHIPGFTQVPIKSALIERLLKHYPRSIAGLKDSSGDWNNTQAMLKQFASEDFDIFCASEVFLSSTMELGGAGCISATVNVNPADIVATWRAAGTGQAAALQAKIDRIRKIFQNYPMIAAMKAALAAGLGEESWKTVRPPLSALSGPAFDALANALDAADFAMLRTESLQ